MKHVAVIGAGVGGLAAGIRLLQQEKEVTLLEKEPRTGGYAIAYRRGGYLFDLALHVVPSGGVGQEFQVLLNTLDVAEKVEFIKLKNGFEVFLGDFQFLMPNNLDELIQSLSQSFPRHAKGLRAFQRDLEKYVSVYAPVFSYGTRKSRSLPPFLFKLPSFLKHSKISTKQYFSHFFEDERLHAILFQPAAFMGIPMTRFSTINFMMMFYLLMQDGMYTVKGGGQKITDVLTEEFLRLGGQIKLNCEVTKLYHHKKEITGIETSPANRLDCDAVIAGNNLPDLVNKLIGREFFSSSFLRALDRLYPSISVLSLHLGLDCPPSALGINNHIAMVFPDPDIDRCFEKQQSEVTPLGYSITANSNSDPSNPTIAGYTLGIVGGTAPERWFNMDPSRYRQAKEEVRSNMIADMTRYVPDLDRHIVVSDLATPRSMHRYTANPQGAIMGFNCEVGDHKPLMDAARLPFSNLKIGSAWTNRLGGFMQSLKSGVIAAEQIK